MSTVKNAVDALWRERERCAARIKEIDGLFERASNIFDAKPSGKKRGRPRKNPIIDERSKNETTSNY